MPLAQFDNIVPFTLKYEGGLSRAKTDYASKYPSPYTYNGKTGWHTNKGVTYATFEKLAPVLKYKNNAENFLTMPMSIWRPIAKTGYWDKIKLDTLKSQAVANILFSFMWGSGYAWLPRISRYLKSKGIEYTGAYYKDKKLIIAKDLNTIAAKFNQLIDKQGEQKTFDELIKQKEDYLKALNQPANLPGWLKRLDALKTESMKFIQNAGLSTFALLIIGLTVYAVLK